MNKITAHCFLCLLVHLFGTELHLIQRELKSQTLYKYSQKVQQWFYYSCTTVRIISHHITMFCTYIITMGKFVDVSSARILCRSYFWMNIYFYIVCRWHFIICPLPCVLSLFMSDMNLFALIVCHSVFACTQFLWTRKAFDALYSDL